jgi:hypothetical protein
MENKRVSIELNDKFSILEGRGGVLTTTISLPRDSLVADVMSDILLSDMGNGYPFDTKPPIIHSSFKDTKLPIDITE